MKSIRLHTLTLENFKNHSKFILSLAGQDASIYGDNASGKTSLYDALTWLLFGKDSKGRSNFDIKPLAADGAVKDHTAITAVTATLCVDGKESILKRTYYEKWSAKRGSSTETYDGNTSDFFVDGVPVKKAEFERVVHEMVSEDMFRILTNVRFFCETLGWKERRETLLSLCSLHSEQERMAQEPRFLPLLEAGLPTDSLRKKLQAERKALTGIRLDTPARLDELKKTIAAIGDTIDFDAVRTEYQDAGRKLDVCKEKLLSIEQDTETATQKNTLQALQNEWKTLQLENEAYRAEQSDVRNASSLHLMLDSLTEQFKRDSRQRQEAEDEGFRAEQEVERYRAQWKTLSQSKFLGKQCPTCQRPLEGETLQAYQETFQREKEENLRALVARADESKARLVSAKKRQEEIAEALTSCETKLAQTKETLLHLTKQTSCLDLPSYPQESDALMARIQSTRSSIAAIEENKEPVVEALRANIQAQESTLKTLKTLAAELAKEAVLQETQTRIQTLTDEMKQAGAKIEEVDELLFLLDEFTRYRVSCIEGDLNRRFDLVSFRLFGEQINGGLLECCEATVGGVPYPSLNAGMQINAGIDVIAALSAHYGITVPLFTDNAESVTRLHPIGTQVIRLVVSEADQTLRVVPKTAFLMEGEEPDPTELSDLSFPTEEAEVCPI